MSYKYNHFTLSCIFITYTLTLTAVQDMEIQILMTHPALRLPFSNQMLFRERLFPTTIAPSLRVTTALSYGTSMCIWVLQCAHFILFPNCKLAAKEVA